MKPELRQFASLKREDFERIPLWMACHGADYDEPWYDDTDEETFRPFSGGQPVEATGGVFLAKAAATLADGSSLTGFVSPDAKHEMGMVQPQLFVGEKRFSFWGGAAGVPQKSRDAFYQMLGKDAASIFPIRFAVAPGLVKESKAISVDGFYRMMGKDRVVVER